MAKTIDARGLTCPAPVLLVKDAVEKTGVSALDVLVDNAASVENVTRFLGSKGYSVTDIREGQANRLSARSDQESTDFDRETRDDGPPGEAGEAGVKIVVLIASDRLGSGDDSLGTKLMESYLKTIKEMGEDLWQLIFVNGGVQLTTASSPVLEDLHEYEKAGVIILACGTCLEHYGLTAEKKVGTTTNMLDIVTATQLADKVISIG